MIKVTVLYNLPPDSDEAAFLAWRMGTHHQANVSRPGVLASDFFRVIGTPLVGPGRPASDSAPYRFMTEAYYPDLETFRRSWENPDEQSRLIPAVARIADALFLVSEELQTHGIALRVE